MSVPISFIFGEETLLVEQHVSRLLSADPNADQRVFEGQFLLNDALNSLNSSDLFASKSIIVIKSPWFLFKSLEKKDIEDINTLLQTSANSPHTVIFTHLGALDQRKKPVLLLKKACDTHVYLAFKDWEQDKLIHWIKDAVTKLNKSIETSAIWALAEIGGTNIRQISGELEKLVVYIGDRNCITKADVIALSANASGSAYQLSEALKKRQIKTIIQLVKRLVDHGDDPLRILGLIASNIRLYIQLASAKKLGLSTDNLAKSIGKNPYFLKMLAPEVTQHYSLEDLLHVHQHLSDIDIAIKSGKQKSIIALELGLLKAF